METLSHNFKTGQHLGRTILYRKRRERSLREPRPKRSIGVVQAEGSVDVRACGDSVMER